MLKILVFFPLLAAAGCPAATEETAPQAAASNRLTLSTTALTNARLATTKAGPTTLRPTVSFAADIVLASHRRAKVVSPLAGVVQKVKHREGQTIARGETLAVLHSRELGEAAVAYLEARHQLSFARSALSREAALQKDGVSAKEAYIKAKHQVEQAALAQKAALQRLAVFGLSTSAANSLVRRSPAQLSQYTLRAPVAGTIIRRTVTRGGSVAAGQQLFEVGDLSRLHAQFPVGMSGLALVSRGSKVSVRIERLKLSAPAVVDFVSPVLATGSRTATIRAEFPNENSSFKPGMAAVVSLTSAAVQVPVAVPRSAVHELDGKHAVFEQTAPGAYVTRFIDRGRGDATGVEVKAGLKAGATVVTQNSLVLKSAWAQQGE